MNNASSCTTFVLRRLTLATLIVGTLLVGCGTGKTMVMDSGESRKANSLAIIEGKSTVTPPTEVILGFKKMLDDLIFTQGGMPRGQHVTLTYRFIQYNEGNRFSRWFLGGIGNTGEGSLSVEAIFSDDSGKQIGKIISEGKIGSGFFGGAIDSAIEKAAEEISNYTISQYR